MKLKNKIIQYSLIVWAFFLFLFISASASAATHYVSPNGSASWASCTNINTPCSLATAASYADDGDVVYIRGGNYGSQRLIPSNSGSYGRVITFARYQYETPSFTRNNGSSVLINGTSYIVIDGLTFSGGSLSQLTIQSHGDYVEVKNCTFSGNATGGYPAVFLGHWSSSSEGISYPYFHDNTFYAQAEAVNEDENDDIATYNMDHGRIINNRFHEGGGHFFVSLYGGSHHNVIRGNNGYVTTYWNSAARPDNASLDGFVELIDGPHNNLIENNFFKVIGDSVARSYPFESAVNTSYNIIRKNTFDHPRSFILMFNNADGQTNNYNMFYNNTFYISGDFYSSSPGVVNLAFEYDKGECAYNQFVNNIWDSSHYNGFKKFYNTTRVHNIQFRGNILYNTGLAGSYSQIVRYGSGMTLSTAQTNSPFSNGDIYSDNLTTQPTYVDTEDSNFMPDSESAIQVDNGVWLTTITSSTGSGTTFTVDNPYFFYDGWNIPSETGDVIKIQNGQTAKITSINYPTGQITVDKSIGWSNGEEIALYYEGARPDIGAKEYSSDNYAISSPKGLIIRVTQ